MTNEELNERFDKISALQAETTVELNAFVVRSAVSEEKLRISEERLRIKVEETSEQIKKTDAKLKSLGIYVGSIADNNGASTEDYFFNSLSDNPVFGGVTYDKVRKNIYSINKRLEDEYDIVMYNGDSIAIIECKYKAHENDLNKLIDKKVDNFRALFPDFKDYAIYLGLASFSFYPELEEMANENGVAILKQKGDVLVIKADKLKAY